VGDSKRQPSFASADQLCHRLSVPRNYDGFAFLDQFEEPGELGLSLVDVDLHTLSLVHFPS
jgi:hypothetical protein